MMADVASRVRKLLALAESEAKLGNEHASRAARRAASRIARRHAAAPPRRVTKGPYVERPDIAMAQCCECRAWIEQGDACQVRIGPYTAAFVHRRCVPPGATLLTWDTHPGRVRDAVAGSRERLTTGPYRDFPWFGDTGAKCSECGGELHGPHLQTLGPGAYQYGYVHVACVPIEERP